MSESVDAKTKKINKKKIKNNQLQVKAIWKTKIINKLTVKNKLQKWCFE